MKQQENKVGTIKYTYSDFLSLQSSTTHCVIFVSIIDIVRIVFIFNFRFIFKKGIYDVGYLANSILGALVGITGKNLLDLVVSL